MKPLFAEMEKIPFCICSVGPSPPPLKNAIKIVKNMKFCTVFTAPVLELIL